MTSKNGQRIIDGLTDAIEGRFTIAKAGSWMSATHDDLPAAIAELKAVLPGWWYSVCECQVSCDATIAPTTHSPDIATAMTMPSGSKFDEGFSVALDQPSTLAEALRFVISEALQAKGNLGPLNAGSKPREDQ